MIFVPLPLFATIALTCAVVGMILTRDIRNRSNALFTLLVALYAVQSLLLSLRWGYGITSISPVVAALAPLLPVCAYLAYLSLTEKPGQRWAWPLAVVAANWVVLAVMRDLADVAILLTFVGFGAAILRRARGGSDVLALARINRAEQAVWAMMLTGGALIASGLIDLFVLVDFIRTQGQNVGLVITLAQSGFLLCIGAAGLVGQNGAVDQSDDEGAEISEGPDEEDVAIHQNLVEMFERDALHQDTELNLRRLARRLRLPDRSVSRAINRTQNMSVSQFVNTFRIKDACTMLADTDQSILQVSLTAGFLTKSNFNREFLRVTGQTPSQWRKEKAQI